MGTQERSRKTYRDAVGVLLANAFGFCLALLERVLVLELGTHGDCGRSVGTCGSTFDDGQKANVMNS